jgi:hypothetical protein
VPTIWFPKGSAVADRFMAGPDGVPVPVRLMDCGVSPALSLMTSEPARVPVVVGVKVTVIVQEELAGREAGQPLKAAKSPLAATPAMLNVSLPTLVRTTF